MRQRLWMTLLTLCPILLFWACQNYQFVYQPQAERRLSHMHFVVQTPSKADILFVIDNSSSMLSKQRSLGNSIDVLLSNLPQDTNYRIGIVSADAHGFVDDCNQVTNPQEPSNTRSNQTLGAKGNCARPEVQLRRPHDGALGRLIAAYDPVAFTASSYSILDTPEAVAAFNCAAPKGAYPVDPQALNDPNCTLNNGARWVLDREQIANDASIACCPRNVCAANCTGPVTRALVQAHFLSNVAALGNRGFGWQEGLKAALWAVGVDPEEESDIAALSPAYNLLALGAPNSYTALDGQRHGWLRNAAADDPTNDALLAVLVLTDQQDCSMPASLMNLRSQYEEPADPVGSVCNQPLAQQGFFNTARLGKLLRGLKHNAPAQVAVGFIGGVKKIGPAQSEGRAGSPNDCIITTPPTATPSNDCACVAGNGDPRWCNFTDQVQSQIGMPKLGCDALQGSRYVDFVNTFPRRTFESICRSDAAVPANEAPSDPNLFAPYGPVLSDFARIATLACFDLTEGLEPAGNDPNLILVKRAAAGTGAEPAVLPQTDIASTQPGWYYDADNRKICLTGLDRIVGDEYDISILDRDQLDFTQ